MNDLLNSKEGLDFFLSSSEHKTLKTILGKYYNEITEFYYNACVTDDFEYKIFLTRRSYVLYRIFSAIFTKFISGYKESGKIFNTYSLPELKEVIKNDNKVKILVADDLIIHGRSIKDIQIELKDVISEKNISLWCILFNDGAEFVNPAEFDYVRVASIDEWKKFSDCVTEFIIASNIGYVSFFDTYYTDKKNADELLKIYEKQKDYIANKYDKMYDIEYKIAFLNKENEYSENDLISCVRFYYTNKKITIIPTVILPAYKDTECKVKCIELLKDKKIQVPSFFEEMNDEKIYLETMRLLSNNLIKDICCNNEYYIYKCNETYKFDKKYNTISSHIEKEYKDITEELGLCEEYLKTAVRKDVNNKNANDKKKYYILINDYINEYLLNVRNEDEKRAFQKKERISGLRLFDFVKSLSENLNYDKKTYDIIANIIWNWDSGKSAYIVKKYMLGENCFIGGVIRNGEQAFRLNYELNNIQYSALYYYFKKTGNYKFLDIKDFMSAIDCKFSTNIFTEFTKKLDYNTLFYDLRAIKPVSFKEDDYPSLENIELFINQYNNINKQ